MTIRQSIIDKGIEQFFDGIDEAITNDIGVLAFVASIAEDLEMSEDEAEYFDYQLPLM